MAKGKKGKENERKTGGPSGIDSLTGADAVPTVAGKKFSLVEEEMLGPPPLGSLGERRQDIVPGRKYSFEIPPVPKAIMAVTLWSEPSSGDKSTYFRDMV